MFDRPNNTNETDATDTRREGDADDGMYRPERAWTDLISEIDDERQRGTAPSHPRVQALMAQWRDLVSRFDADHANDPARSEGPQDGTPGEVDSDLRAYIDEALAASPETAR